MPSLYGTYGQPKKKKKKKKAVTLSSSHTTKPKLIKKKPRPVTTKAKTSKPIKNSKTGKAAKRTKALNRSLSSKVEENDDLFMLAADYANYEAEKREVEKELSKAAAFIEKEFGGPKSPFHAGAGKVKAAVPDPVKSLIKKVPGVAADAVSKVNTVHPLTPVGHARRAADHGPTLVKGAVSRVPDSVKDAVGDVASKVKPPVIAGRADGLGHGGKTKPDGTPKGSADTKQLTPSIRRTPSPFAERLGVEDIERESYDAERRARIRSKDKPDAATDALVRAGVDTPAGAATAAALATPWGRSAKIGTNILRIGSRTKNIAKPVKQTARSKAKVAAIQARADKVAAKADDMAGLSLGRKTALKKADKLQKKANKRATQGGQLRRRVPTPESAEAGVRNLGRGMARWSPAQLAVGTPAYAEAFVDDPREFIRTTERTVAGLPSAIIGPADAVYKSAKHGRTDPIEAEFKENLDFYKKMFAVSPFGNLDSEKAQDVIQREIGALGPITAALGTGAAGQFLPGAYRGRPIYSHGDAVPKYNTRQWEFLEELKDMDAKLNAGETLTKAEHAKRKNAQRHLDDMKGENLRAGQLARSEVSQEAAKNKDIVDTVLKAVAMDPSSRTLGGLVGRVLTGRRLGNVNKNAAKLKDAALGVTAKAEGENAVVAADLVDVFNEHGIPLNNRSWDEARPAVQAIVDASVRRPRPPRGKKEDPTNYPLPHPIPGDKIPRPLGEDGRPERALLETDVLKRALLPEYADRMQESWSDFQALHRHGLRVQEVTNRQRRDQGISEVQDRAATLAPAARTAGVPTFVDFNMPNQWRYKDVDSLREQAAKAEANEDSVAAADFEARADAKFKEAEKYSDVAAQEAIDSLEKAIGKNEYTSKKRDPDTGKMVPVSVDARVYRPHQDATESNKVKVEDVNAPPPTHPILDMLRTLELADQGKVKPGDGLDTQTTRLVEGYQRKTLQEFRENQEYAMRQFGYEGKMVDTPEAFAAALQRGQLPPNSRFVNSEDLGPDVDIDPASKARKLGDPELNAKAVQLVDGRSWDQFTKLATYNPGTFQKGLRTVMRLQSLGMLAMSPVWFEMQLIASPIALATAHSNPITLIKGMHHAMEDFRNMDPAVRAEFKGGFGAVSAQVFDMHELKTAVTAKGTRDVRDAYLAANSSMAKRAGSAAKKGGPLIIGNIRYEGWVRSVGAAIEMEKIRTRGKETDPVTGKVSERSRGVLQDMAKKVGLVNQSAGNNLEKMQGMNRQQQVDFYLKNPKEAKLFAQRVNDALGSWNKMTALERKASSLLVFYPFVRFSANWLFRTLPEKHPAKLALLLNMAQANAISLDNLEADVRAEDDAPISEQNLPDGILDKAPAAESFRDYGVQLTRNADGSFSNTGVDVLRALPGAGPAVEFGSALMEGGRNPLTLLTSLMGPGIQGLTNVAFRKKPYSGEHDDSPLLQQAARNLAAITVPTRYLSRSDSPYAVGIRRLEGRGNPFPVGPQGDFPILSGGPVNTATDLVNELSGEGPLKPFKPFGISLGNPGAALRDFVAPNVLVDIEKRQQKTEIVRRLDELADIDVGDFETTEANSNNKAVVQAWRDGRITDKQFKEYEAGTDGFRFEGKGGKGGKAKDNRKRREGAAMGTEDRRRRRAEYDKLSDELKLYLHRLDSRNKFTDIEKLRKQKKLDGTFEPKSQYPYYGSDH